MRICTATIKGVTPYSPSRAVDPAEVPRLPKEGHEEYDERTWRMKATTTEAGEIAVPQMALKFAVDEAVKRLAMQIPGRGKTTYTKFFVAGQICEADMPIGVHIDDVKPIKIWANADGVRGSGKRVRRLFPYVPNWSGVARFALLDDVIPSDTFERALVEAGRLIGVGRFRPEKGGVLGRFEVTQAKWTKE